jgi:hypothetical protein
MSHDIEQTLEEAFPAVDPLMAHMEPESLCSLEL